MTQNNPSKNKKHSRINSGTNELQKKSYKKEKSCINFNQEKTTKGKIPIQNYSSRITTNKKEPNKNEIKSERKNNIFRNSKSSISEINQPNYDIKKAEKLNSNNKNNNTISYDTENYSINKNTDEYNDKENYYFNENKNNNEEEIEYKTKPISQYKNENYSKRYQSSTFTNNTKYQTYQIPDYSEIKTFRNYNNYGKNTYTLENKKIDISNYSINENDINMKNNLVSNNEDIRLAYLLRKLGLTPFLRTFDANHISFIDFLFLTEDDLIEMSIPSYYIKKILDFIKNFTIVAKNYSINEISNYFQE